MSMTVFMKMFPTQARAMEDIKREAHAKSMIRPCKVYSGLNTAKGYNAAPPHIRECWKRNKKPSVSTMITLS